MKIRLDLTDVPSSAVSNLQFDPRYDDIRKLLMDVCEQVEESGRGTFIVSGFGDDSWPVQVATDLPVLLEQLPSAIVAVTQKSSFTINFYEQGIERILYFRPSGEDYLVECTSFLDWKPAATHVPIHTKDLTDMLFHLKTEFINFLSRIEMANSIQKCFSNWASHH
jgi:hypothetical protein